MGAKDHGHDWASTSGGYQCSGCSAFISDAEIAANPPTGKNHQASLNQIQKKIHTNG